MFRRRLASIIRRRAAWHGYIALLLLAALALFGLTQLRDIHFKASGYLFVSAFTLLCLAWWQLGPRGQRQTWLPVYASRFDFALLCQHDNGVALLRKVLSSCESWRPSLSCRLYPGALWGVALGCLLRQADIRSPYRDKWITRYKAFSLAIAFALLAGIIIGQARMLPKLETFAREWDERHSEIIRQRDSGQDVIVVPELSYNFAYDLIRWHIFDYSRGQARFGCLLRGRIHHSLRRGRLIGSSAIATTGKVDLCHRRDRC